MSQLALDDVQRDALPGHLDGVGVAQLVWSETPPHAGLGSRCVEAQFAPASVTRAGHRSAS